jgi:hypothetical protein
MVPAFWMWVGKSRGYGRQLREYLENIKEMCQCHGACFLDVGGSIPWVRETIERISRDMEEMCKFHRACFLDVGLENSWIRETIKKISREYAGNVPVSWRLLFGCGWEKVVSTGVK